MKHIRKAVVQDIDAIMWVVEDGILSLKRQGLPQWQNGFGPSREKILEDIQREEGYIFIAEKKIAGYASLVSGIDPVYTAIEEGFWETKMPEKYLSVHRFCVSSSYTGKKIGQTFLQELSLEAKALGYSDVRIDTYPKNMGMQKVILNCGFSERGMVYFPIPEGQRKAYQKLL